MDNSINENHNKNNLQIQKTKKKKRISEVVPIYTQFGYKKKHDIENLLINNQESISYNNINILKTDLPHIVTNLSQIEVEDNIRIPPNKSVEGKNYIQNSRNINNLDPDKYNTTTQIRRYTQNKKTKYTLYDNNSMNLSQLVWQKSKNMGFVGSSKNKNSRNIDINNNYIHKNNKHFLTNINNTNNLSTSFTTKNNNEKIKFTVNKKNLINTIKKPTKIKIEKKNLKYKIPLDLMNNINKKKLEYNYDRETNNNNIRKLNIKQRNINNRSLSNNKINHINNDVNDSKSFIESTLVAFNGLVSKAQEIGQILIDNKEIIHENKDNNLINNQLKNSIEILNVDKKIDKLDKKIKNEQKTVEELQKINLDLNNKINLFNENSQQYENKVKELVDVINQLKQNNSNNVSNNNSNNSNGETANQNSYIGEQNNKFIPCNTNSNFTLEKKPKRKKIKFGFVESIFMKPDKFQIINNRKPNVYKTDQNDNFYINKTKKENKLVFVNINKNYFNENNNSKIKKITSEEYQDAAEQMANHLIIESIMSLENEDEN